MSSHRAAETLPPAVIMNKKLTDRVIEAPRLPSLPTIAMEVITSVQEKRRQDPQVL